MLPIKTPCHCGQSAQMIFLNSRYIIVCTACGFTSLGAWATMTVAIIDWEDSLLSHKAKTKAPPLK